VNIAPIVQTRPGNGGIVPPWLQRKPFFIAPNGIDAPWEMLDGYDREPMGFYDSREDAYRAAMAIVRRTNTFFGELDTTGTLVRYFFP